MTELKVMYEGPHASGVEVADLDNMHVPRCQETEVPDDIGARLCEQAEHWREIKPNGKGK